MQPKRALAYTSVETPKDDTRLEIPKEKQCHQKWELVYRRLEILRDDTRQEILKKTKCHQKQAYTRKLNFYGKGVGDSSGVMTIVDKEREPRLAFKYPSKQVIGVEFI